MARLSRDCIITEKIDGTNASIYIRELPNNETMPTDTPIVAVRGNLLIYAGSRTRWITPANDNFGFAQWVLDNAAELFKLGVGHHFGEWWGSGIQRNYGYKKGERFFSLFDATRWTEHNYPVTPIKSPNPTEPTKYTQHAPNCCLVVPVLYEGLFDTDIVRLTLYDLKCHGSVAAKGFKNPEGIIVYHVAANTRFKKTIENALQEQQLSEMRDQLAEATSSCRIWQKGHSEIVEERDEYYNELLTKRGLCKVQKQAVDEWKAEAERWRSLSQGWKEEAVEHINEASRLVEGIRGELRKNAHLADGEDCTLIGLKRLIGYEEGAEL